MATVTGGTKNFFAGQTQQLIASGIEVQSITATEVGGVKTLTLTTDRSASLFETEEVDTFNVAGTTQSDVFLGQGGIYNADVGGGDDNVYTADGNDTITAGSGDDVVFTLVGDDVSYGGTGYDLIAANQGSDTVYGGDDDDTVHGGQGDDVVSGDGDDDLLFGDRGRDVVSGGQGDDIVHGNQNNDTLFGGTGNDSMYGGRDNDTLYGGEGNDVLYGDRGTDVVYGGDGEDIFYIDSNAGQDFIMDFSTGDRIFIEKNINGLEINTVGDLVSHISAGATPSQVVIDLGSGASVTLTLNGVTEADLKANPDAFFKLV